MTAEPYSKIRRSFSNLSRFYIIDIDDFIANTTFDLTDPGHLYIMNDEVERMLKAAFKSRKHTAILYINGRMSSESVMGIKRYVDSMDGHTVDNFVLFDDYDVPRMQVLYDLFDEIYFFHSLRKTRIIECKPMPRRK